MCQSCCHPPLLTHPKMMPFLGQPVCKDFAYTLQAGTHSGPLKSSAHSTAPGLADGLWDQLHSSSACVLLPLTGLDPFKKIFSALNSVSASAHREPNLTSPIQWFQLLSLPSFFYFPSHCHHKTVISSSFKRRVPLNYCFLILNVKPNSWRGSEFTF